MSNELVKHEPREISAPTIFTDEQIQTIKNIYCKGATDDEFKVYLYTCQRTGLDPFAKQIYYIKRGNQMTIQTSIDGYRLVADRTGKYAPGQEPTYVHDAHGKLLSATAYIKKLTKDGTWHIVPATAHFDEYVQVFNGKPTGLWLKMPRTMLAKCAEALAIRKAFPAELSGVYTKEEMDQADVVDITNHPDVEPVKLPNIEEMKPIEYITKGQILEIEQLKLECDPKKLDNIDEWLKKKCKGGPVSQLKVQDYDEVMGILLDRRGQYQAKLFEEKMNGEETANDKTIE